MRCNVFGIIIRNHVLANPKINFTKTLQRLADQKWPGDEIVGQSKNSELLSHATQAQDIKNLKLRYNQNNIINKIQMAKQ